MKPTILTNHGFWFNITDPYSYDYPAFEIAESLAKLCRFGGHCRGFYSVAQHSVIVSNLVPMENARHGLLHDAAEAYLGDMVAPLKKLLPEYRAIEDRVQKAIYAAYGMTTETPAMVRHADLLALAIERRDVMPDHDEEWECLEGILIPDCLDYRIEPMTPDEAKRAFIDRWLEINDWEDENNV